MGLYPFVLLHYSIMLICTLAVSGGMSAPTVLNSPSKKGNLKASHECPHARPPTPSLLLTAYVGVSRARTSGR